MNSHQNQILNDKQYKSMANAIRALTIDAIEKANSGHPGMPLGMADFMAIFYSEFFKFNPNDPTWADRDRLILSAGHGSMLLYATLFLSGYQDITIQDIQKFRSIGAKTAGHPEYGMLDGIETTTGPLGQGLANAVGMAIAERSKNAKFGDELINHKIYTICGDGCLMEGISHEAISLAGHLNLSNLVVIFDDNKISIDGPTSITISDNYQQRFQSCNWNYIEIDGHDFSAIRKALESVQKTDKPTLIATKTTIGCYSPNKSGTEKCHGAPLGEQESILTKKAMCWEHEPFKIPDDILALWRNSWRKNEDIYKKWQQQNISQLEEFQNNNSNIDNELAQVKNLVKNISSESTRVSSQRVINHLYNISNKFIGGSADLSGSNCTKIDNHQIFTAKNYAGNYIYYGIREHAMVAIMNGIALDKGYIPYGGTFLVFSDYCRASIRLAALMKLQIILIMTHDSIGVGEDGPTHQPVEHLASLRSIPNLLVFRPADLFETVECWQLAIQHKSSPSLISCSRQNIQQIQRDIIIEQNLSSKGMYIVKEQLNPVITIIATGSEFEIAYEIYNMLLTQKIHCKLVSAPCLELFDQQPKSYKEQILDKSTIKLVIEAGIKMCWDKYLTENDLFFGVDDFGMSGNAKDIYNEFGITSKNILNIINERIKNYE
jgi:transketolase